MSLTNSPPGEAANAARLASRTLAILSGSAREDALATILESLRDDRSEILAANARELKAAARAAENGVLTQSLIKRLNFSKRGKCENMLQAIASDRGPSNPADALRDGKLDRSLIQNSQPAFENLDEVREGRKFVYDRGPYTREWTVIDMLNDAQLRSTLEGWSTTIQALERPKVGRTTYSSSLRSTWNKSSTTNVECNSTNPGPSCLLKNLPCMRLQRKQQMLLGAMFLPAAFAILAWPEVLRFAALRLSIETGFEEARRRLGSPEALDFVEKSCGGITTILSAWKAVTTQTKEEWFATMLQIVQALTIGFLGAYVGLTIVRQTHRVFFFICALAAGMGLAGIVPGRDFREGVEAFIAFGFWVTGMVFDDAAADWANSRWFGNLVYNTVLAWIARIWGKCRQVLNGVCPEPSPV